MFAESAGLLLWRLIQVIKCLAGIATRLTLIVIVEGLRINQHAHHNVTVAALKNVLESDAMRARWFGHIPQLILQVVHLVFSLNLPLQLLNNLPEEHIDHKCINSSFVKNIKHSPEVLDGLRRLLVFHCEHEVKECFVVHFALKGLELLKDAIDENLCEARCIPRQLRFLQHAVFVRVQLQVLIVDAKGAVHTEPVRNLILGGHLLLAQLIQFSQNRARHHVLDLDFACAFGVQEEEELPH